MNQYNEKKYFLIFILNESDSYSTHHSPSVECWKRLLRVTLWRLEPGIY